MRLKTFVFIFCAFLVLAFTATCVFAADVVTERTGTIVIVTPDGTITTVGPNDPLPPMPSGTAITVISGTIKMSPAAGSYSVTIGDTTVTIGAGDSVECGFDSTGQVQVGSTSGTIETVTNGVQVSIPAGGTATIDVDSSGQVTVAAEGADVTVTPPDGTPETVPAGSSSTTQGTSTVGQVETETETEEEIDNKDLEEKKKESGGDISPSE